MLVRRHEGVASLVGDERYPWRIGFAVPFLEPDDVGFPGSDEFEALERIEDRICDVLEVEHASIHVLTITTNGMREFVLYAQDERGAKAAFETLFEFAYPHDLQMVVEEDPAWQVYRDFKA